MLQVAGAHDNSDEDDSTEPTHQSPWELFDEGLDAHTAAQEGPALDSPVAERLKHAVQILSASELFEVFVDLLEPDAAYPASDTGLLTCCASEFVRLLLHLQLLQASLSYCTFTLTTRPICRRYNIFCMIDSFTMCAVSIW